MSAYHGPQGRGAARIRKARKKAEAVERNERTLPERRRAYRPRLTLSSPVASNGSARGGVTPVVPAGVGGQPEHTNPE